jgi:hypothetical protein
MLGEWRGMKGGKGGDSFWTDGEAFTEAWRKKGMFSGASSLDDGAWLLTGGPVIDRNA